MPRDVALLAHQRGPLTVHSAPTLTELGLDVFVTDRFNGVSEGLYESLNLGDHVGDDEDSVRQNRALVARAAGVEPERLVTVRQVHGTSVLDSASVTNLSEADALVTETSDLALAILVADCVPIACADTSSGRVALVHAGWRGLRDGVIACALEGFDPHTTHAFIGPSISKGGYQVGPEVAQYFTTIEGAVSPDGGDRSRLDLRLVATHQLRGAGIGDDHVERSLDVTDGGEIFYSDRAQRPCGRFAIVARRAVA